MPDRGGLVLESFLSRREEEDKLCYREGLCPVVEIVGVVEDIVPSEIEERRQFPPRSLWTMAEKDDSCLKNLVESERKTRRKRKRSVGRRCRPSGEVGVIGGSVWVMLLRRSADGRKLETVNAEAEVDWKIVMSLKIAFGRQLMWTNNNSGRNLRGEGLREIERGWISASAASERRMNGLSVTGKARA